ncbi:MAG TPA: triose-phosphate isomerase [Gammaproteobacteria bacterium]|nr:triose-phosphate isomerase [Gammaproteobacteria bacterium]
MRRPLVAGNWKMHGSRESVASLLEGIKAGMAGLGDVEVAVCPPFVYLPQAAELLQGTAIGWGGQNLCQVPGSGAYTGEISDAMLKDFGCRYVIVGHSERRNIYGESDALVAEKFLVAARAGLVPIVCVGELLEERERGATEAVVGRQLDALLAAEGGLDALRGAVIAYEPVWAIGTGKTATPEQAQAVHAFIRARLAEHDAALAEGIRILYGGSVKPGNAAELFGMDDIDGGLIGGASLQAEDFLAICGAAQQG